MELLFLAVLLLLMVGALTAGYPVAFALPGASILAVTLAALCGYWFAGDPSAYFAQDGPNEWLSAGVTNFRSLYWDVERDTLIAIPLFVFMGIMLQRSKIAEDLLLMMARLFGPVPGGLGISVVFVGALLAATTGIVGATVIAMGLISLPAMLRSRYSKSLASGTICASGTLGQIIPPSIVLIILADQLSSAVDQAGTIRKAEYREITGEFSMPSEFAITSASVGDMFMGALIPGVLLVVLYMAYILIRTLFRPDIAPPVPYDGEYDRKFWWRVAVTLIPPLTLIFIVLGSIVMGVATVNQAGAIGAIGAMIMAGYRLLETKEGEASKPTITARRKYAPAYLAIASIVVLFLLLQQFDLNIKGIQSARDVLGITLAAIAVAVLTFAVLWSAWRAYTIDDTLRGVMIETAKTTCMVFIILIGAAMLTSAFRGFGGEHLVKEFLTGLPGGFWTQFIVVMAVIFLLGFFLDFIEIAVVVVPIVAPILLADPSANITAVWLGVMIGLNIQTSFLTPPFGFALFYVRGVAPPQVKTTQIYKGAVAFIVLQLVGLGIAGYFPSLVNYLPNRVYLTSETAPPPVNPRLQYCIEQRVFAEYQSARTDIRAGIQRISTTDLSPLPTQQRTALAASFTAAADTFTLVETARRTTADLTAYTATYAPLHRQVRRTQRRIRALEQEIAETETRMQRLAQSRERQRLRAQRDRLLQRKATLQDQIPATWQTANATYTQLQTAAQQARARYRRHVDRAYQPLADTRALLHQRADLNALQPRWRALQTQLNRAPTLTPTEITQTRDQLQTLTRDLNRLQGTAPITAQLSQVRRALNIGTSTQAAQLFQQATRAFSQEIAWRTNAAPLLPQLDAYNDLIKSNIGLRQQTRLNKAQAKQVAACQAQHRDISLNF